MMTPRRNSIIELLVLFFVLLVFSIPVQAGPSLDVSSVSGPPLSSTFI